MRQLILILLFFSAAVSSSAYAQFDAAVSIPRFGKVDEGIYRGARPQNAGLQELKNLGVKTVINLDNDRAAVIAEVEQARALGIQEVLLPLHGWMTPDDETVDAALEAVIRTAPRPVCIHCEFGQDRTGLIVGLYRVFHQKWTPRKAFQEMRAYGFSRLQVFMKEYFEDRTNTEL